MLKPARRPVASLCIVLLAFNVVGCHHTTQQPPRTVIPADGRIAQNDQIRGVTLNDGRVIKFDKKPPAEMARDTLRANVQGQPTMIPVSDIQRVWIESYSGARTTFLILGVTVAAFAALVAIALATKESCPFVYSWDGTQYVFDGEPYGGAVTRGLERDDYSDLEHLRPDAAGLYRLLVTNEVNETQFTNSMELVVVDHIPGTRFEMDEWGKLHSVSKALPPTSARDQDGRDLVAWLRASDEMIWEPAPPMDATGAVRQEIVLTFPKPRNAKRAQLVARAGTGLWGSHMIREMLQLRGSAVTEWYATLDKGGAPLDALRAWNVREELYVLKLDVDESGTWRPRGLLPGGGPFIAETRIVPLDLSNAPGDSLRLRIRPPSGFWALNSFAVTYDDTEQPLAITTVQASSARTSDGRDMLGELRAADDRYYAMPNTGDNATISFVTPPTREGAERSVFLHTRGYYRLHLPEQGPGDAVTLQRLIDQPDAAARLAAKSFAKQRLARSGN
jgi:hypothetical protein